MKNNDPWMMLRTGDVETGLKQFRRAYEREPTTSHIMELGVAYLWVQQFEAAWELFRLSIERYPESMSSFYGMAGAAKWCLGEPDEAVRQWSAGLKSKYADANGLGLQMPLLLYMASELRPKSYRKDSAEKLLRAKVKDPRVNDWPGPIARLLLDQISEKDFLSLCCDGDEVEAHDRNWLARFYKAVLGHGEGQIETFRVAMRVLSDTSTPEWAGTDFFLARMWSEEFFVARYEASIASR